MDLSFLHTIPWIHLLAAAALLFVIVGVWVLILYKWNPEFGTMDSADVTACLRGKCGDAMEISLKFRDGRVFDAKFWTDGCRFSNDCGAAAARLAINRTPEEIADIDYLTIAAEVGGLPEEDLHCATLAAGTLQESLRKYFAGDGEGNGPRAPRNAKHH